MGVPEALFSLKTFIAAALAYYIALRIGLLRPYWAVITCYIVAQPLAGAVLSKALFRLVGTIIGTGIAILLVPALVNLPELLICAIALWLGLCTFLSRLDRTPRSYLFLLAGYSAAIVGLPTVNSPETIFTIASLRVQEITIGIMSAALVHGLVFPQTVTQRLLVRTATILEDAERWTRDALGASSPTMLDLDRRRLALDIHELHQLAVHLPFDTARTTPNVAVLSALQERLSLLLPLVSAVEDRLRQLQSQENNLPGVAVLLEDVRSWLTGLGDVEQDGTVVDGLMARARALEPDGEVRWTWSSALLLSLLDRLAKLVEVHEDCRALRSMLAGTRNGARPHVVEAVAKARTRPMHRDYGEALRAALATAVTVVAGCLLWIESEWPDGASAVVIASIVCALFSNLDNPVPTVTWVLLGTVAAMIVGAVYAFVILPRVTDIVPLIAVLAPAYLVIGTLAARPNSVPFAIGMILTLPGTMGLNASYSTSFDGFCNAALAQSLGVLLAVLALTMVRSPGSEARARQLVRTGWRDLARMAAGRGSVDISDWISQMLDRVGLLTPRLLALGIDAGQPMLDVLADTRVGIAIAELRTFQARAPASAASRAAVVLRSVERHYRGLRSKSAMTPNLALARTIDRAFPRIAATPDFSIRRSALLALTSLRRNLAATLPIGGGSQPSASRPNDSVSR